MALTRVAGCGRWAPLLILQYVIEVRALQARLHEAVDESTNQIGGYCEGKRGGWRRHGVRPRPVRQCAEVAQIVNRLPRLVNPAIQGVEQPNLGKTPLRAIYRWLSGQLRVQTLAS